VKHILFVIDSSAGDATGDEMEAIDAFNDQLEADGYWILAAGIVGPERALVVDNRAGAGTVAHQAIHQGHPEHIAGFWIIDVPDAETALRLALDGSKACNRKVEVRAFLG